MNRERIRWIAEEAARQVGAANCEAIESALLSMWNECAWAAADECLSLKRDWMLGFAKHSIADFDACAERIRALRLEDK